MKSRVRLKKGDPLVAIRKLEKINERFKGPDVVRVGLPRNSNPYPDGTSVIMVGLVHEFGSATRGVPERSYLRSTVREKHKKYRKELQQLARKVLRGDMTKAAALNTFGTIVQTDVREKITDIKTPALTSRPGGNPLVDTGHLRQSIIYVVGQD